MFRTAKTFTVYLAMKGREGEGEKSDSHRIQTYNLLIRSQMLYSVELASHCLLTSMIALEIGRAHV